MKPAHICRSLVLVSALLILGGAVCFAEPPLIANVVCEETVAVWLPPNNGAGPLWCYGSPLLFRDGDDVYASISETGVDVPPLSNTRWALYRRSTGAWKKIQTDSSFRQREPSPFGGIPGQALLMTTNPSNQPPGTKYGPCDPELLVFQLPVDSTPPKVERPVWPGTPYYTDHSYRGFAVDSERKEALWLNIDAHTSVQNWSLRNAEGEWIRNGGISFPVRSCYPQVALRGGSAHVLAIGDIVEPIEEWKAFKYELTKSGWDYVFRRLFYTYTPDISQKDFIPPVEIDSVDSTGGHISNLDLWIGPDGTVHTLYIRNNIQTPQLRDRYFPGMPILRSLEYTALREGRITQRETLVAGGEVQSGTDVQYGRFHSTPDGRLWAVYSAQEKGTHESHFYLMPISPRLERNNKVVFDLKEPLGTFFTASQRGGSLPSWTLDMFGSHPKPETLGYVQIQLTPR